jgi:hypothetical protein
MVAGILRIKSALISIFRSLRRSKESDQVWGPVLTFR